MTATMEDQRQTAAPDRSLQQRLDALEHANEIRSQRAKVKQDVKHGHVSVTALLHAPPDYMDAMRVADLIIRIPKYGRVKVNRALNHCRISPSKTIGGLTHRQRTELLEALLGR